MTEYPEDLALSDEAFTTTADDPWPSFEGDDLMIDDAEALAFPDKDLKAAAEASGHAGDIDDPIVID